MPCSAGQNIAAGGPPSDIDAIITDQFYSEVKYYKWYGAEPDMTNFLKWGHFSQIAWKGTSRVACVTKHCTGGLAKTGPNVRPYFTVCNYASAGNVGGQYAENVLKPSS